MNLLKKYYFIRNFLYEIIRKFFSGRPLGWLANSGVLVANSKPTSCFFVGTDNHNNWDYPKAK